MHVRHARRPTAALGACSRWKTNGRYAQWFTRAAVRPRIIHTVHVLSSRLNGLKRKKIHEKRSKHRAKCGGIARAAKTLLRRRLEYEVRGLLMETHGARHTQYEMLLRWIAYVQPTPTGAGAGWVHVINPSIGEASWRR